MLNKNLSMKQKIQGATAAGWLIIVMVVLFFIYITIKLVPVYMEYGSVKSSMTSLYEQKVAGETNKKIKSLLQNRFNINSIDSVKGEDATIKDTANGKVIVIKYDKKVSLFGNVSALVEFEHEQPLQ